MTVFIASSFEMRSDRIALGDCIRQLDDLYESKGVRIRLHCWEDYKPEYTGERKQDEYNRDLVMSSQIIIGLFKSICGTYTQEEIKLGIASKGKEHVHCFYRISEKGQCLGGDIANFFYENKIQALPYKSSDAICREVSSIVEEYIDEHGLMGDTPLPAVHRSKVYATIPDGLQTLVPEVGNIIRQLDYICERNFNTRCKLWALKSPQYICNSDYYITIYDKEYSEYDIYELTQADMARATGLMNAQAIYSLPEANITGHKLQALLAQWGHFPIRLENLDVLRLNTLIYLISNLKSQTSLSAGNFISLYNNQIRCHGLYVAPISALDLLKGGLLTNDIKDLEGVLSEMYSIEEATHGRIFEDPTQEYLKLSAVKERLQERLTQYVCFIIDFLLKETECTIKENQRLRDLYQEKQYKTIISEVDTKALVSSATHDIQVIGNRKESLNANIERFDLKIKSLLSVLMGDTSKECYIKELRIALDDKLSVQENAYKHRLTSEGEIIKTLHLQIQVADTWQGYSPTEEDVLYSKIVTYADCGKLSDLDIENLRGNHANALSRAYRYQEAFEQYEKAIGNLLVLDDGNRIVKKCICQTYLNYVSCFDGFYDDSHVNVLNRWKNLIVNYIKEDDSFNIELVNVYIKQIHHLPPTSSIVNIQVAELEAIIKEVVADFNNYEELEQHNLLYSVIVLACFYIDRLCQNTALCTHKATFFLDMALGLCEQYKKQAPKDGLIYNSMINHNYGFLMAGNLCWSEAENYYESAYQERKCLFDCNDDEDTKDSLAETAVNYADCLLQLRRYDDAVGYAKQAVVLYRSLLQSEYNHTYMNFYKAQQMLGSVYVHIPNKKEEGLDMLAECWAWAESHPDNSYYTRFRDVSYGILKESGRVI